MNPSSAQALVIVDELLRCGVSDVVLAPGSRSAPLALALAEAEARGDLRLHVRIDERVAAFVALGMGKVTGIPAPVVTTSGTAVANMLPAVIEADHSGVPLLLITADRPPRLRGVRANQTIAQTDVFGSRVREAIDMGVAPWESPQSPVPYWRSVVSRAVGRATDAMVPGPVHLNVPFDEPLVPTDDDQWDFDLAGRPNGRPWTADARLTAGMSTPLDDVLVLLDEEMSVPTHGLIIVGDHDDDEVALIDELGEALGWPVISEPSGNAGGCTTALSHGPLICEQVDFMADHAPEVVITVGTVGLHRSLMRVIAHAPIHIAVDSRPQWSDPTRSADLVVASVPLPPEEFEVDESWWASWQSADVLTAAAVETVLASTADKLTGMQVARAVAARIPDAGVLYLGASSAVRYVSAFAATAAQESVMVGNRGTSGIDGVVSSAWGAALALGAVDGGASVALVGDQTFLYDSNAFLVPENEERPDLVIVVMDNDGGGIFSTLEQNAAEPEIFERVFGVPLGMNLSDVCKGLGVPSVTVNDLPSLQHEIESRVGTGVHVVIAHTVPRATEAEVLRDIEQAVGSALTRS